MGPLLPCDSHVPFTRQSLLQCGGLPWQQVTVPGAPRSITLGEVEEKPFLVMLESCTA